jgi:glycosyltransferase involved in cell wall biosynthesis
MRKSLLVFTHTLPHPPVSGGKIRYHYLLQSLARRFDLYLLSLARGTDGENDAAWLRTFCREVRLVPFRKTKPTRRGKIRNLLSLRPADLNYENARAVAAFSDLVLNRPIQGVLIWTSFLASYVRLVPMQTRRVLDLDDLQFVRMKRAVTELPWGKKKIGYLLEPTKAKWFERLMLRRFDLAFTCSEVDRSRVARFGTGPPVRVVANGVDPERFDPKDFQEWTRPALVYIGGLGSQGGEGVLRFMEKIFPLIREKVPEVRLHLVGGEILPQLGRAALRSSSVVLEGVVNDVRPYMAGGWVFVVPLWIGSGTRVKILEACAMQRAVVSTPVGAEGLDLAPGRHLFVEETPERFAARCVELLKNPGLRRETGQRAREEVCSRYNWSKIGDRAADILDELMG